VVCVRFADIFWRCFVRFVDDGCGRHIAGYSSCARPGPITCHVCPAARWTRSATARYWLCAVRTTASGNDEPHCRQHTSSNSSKLESKLSSSPQTAGPSPCRSVITRPTWSARTPIFTSWYRRRSISLPYQVSGGQTVNDIELWLDRRWLHGEIDPRPKSCGGNAPSRPRPTGILYVWNSGMSWLFHVCVWFSRFAIKLNKLHFAYTFFRLRLIWSEWLE